MATSNKGLTEEQRRRMEENKRQAMLKRAQRMNANPVGASSNGPQKMANKYPGAGASSSNTRVQATSSTLSAPRVPPTQGGFIGTSGRTSAPSSSSSASSVTSASSSRTNIGGQAGKLWRPECLTKPNAMSASNAPLVGGNSNASSSSSYHLAGNKMNPMQNKSSTFSSMTSAGNKDSYPVAQAQAKVNGIGTNQQQNNYQQKSASAAQNQTCNFQQQQRVNTLNQTSSYQQKPSSAVQNQTSNYQQQQSANTFNQQNNYQQKSVSTVQNQTSNYQQKSASTIPNQTSSYQQKTSSTVQNQTSNFQQQQNTSTGNHQTNQQPKAFGPPGQKTLMHFYGSKTTGSDAGNKGSVGGQATSSTGSRAAAQQFKGSNVQPRLSSTASILKPGGEFPSSPSLAGQCILISRSRFMVDIGFHAKLIEIFKSINSKSYDMNTKKWSFSMANYDELMEACKVLKNEVTIKPLPQSVLLAFRSQRQGNFTKREVPEVELEVVDEKLVQALMPFQRIGVNFAIHHGGRALIADEMGLGKTIQALCVACYYRQEWPVLVVTPSSMRFAWSEAFLKWIPSVEEEEINVVISGKDVASKGLINIISYDLLARQGKAMMAKRFKVIIMDESHFLKNYKTARTKAALPLLKCAARVILLSGTPALSRPSELFQQLNIVNPRLFPSFHDFAARYCDAKQTHFGWDYSGSSNLAELQILLEEKVMVRRLKKDVLKQLPSKMRQVVMMDPGIVKTASKSLQCAAKDMQKKSKSEQHGALLKYFSETGAAKIPALREYIVDMADGGNKFLVFAHHQTVLDAMSEALSKHKIKHIRIDGSTASHHRNELVEKFQTNDSFQVAVLSITACNAGITLTAASSVIFAELFWNPGILVQAEDRVHRIGQQDSVTVRYLIAKGTADDYIWPLVQKKLETLSKAGLSGDDFQAADKTELKDPRQKSILSYFETSFFEDDELSQDDLNMLDAAEAAVYSEEGKENSSSCNSDVSDSAKTTEKGSLFSSFTNGPAVKKPRMS